jgi:hypothetical protein
VKIKGLIFLRWFGIEGIVLYPFIFFAAKNPDLTIQQHEDIHWQQIKNAGILGFYKTYLHEYFLGRKQGLTHDRAYRNISFEQEAYAQQRRTNYLATLESTQSYRKKS